MSFPYAVRRKYISGLFLFIAFSYIPFKCGGINVACRRMRNADAGFVKYYGSGNFREELQTISKEPGFKGLLAEIRSRGCKAVNIVVAEGPICAGRIFDEEQVLEIEKETGEVFGIDTAVVLITPDFTIRYTPFEQRVILAHELGHILKFFDVLNGEKDYLWLQPVESQVNNYIADFYVGDEEWLSPYAIDYLPQFA